jgi:hypothetical protein
LVEGAHFADLERGDADWRDVEGIEVPEVLAV